MSAKKLTRHFYHFLLLYDFASFHSPVLGNCANRVPVLLSALSVQAGCSAHSSNAAHTAKAQPCKKVRHHSKAHTIACQQRKALGQLPAQAQRKGGKPGCAQCSAIVRVPGWCAHRVEEVVFANRIIRPAYKYLGVRQKYKPIEER